MNLNNLNKQELQALLKDLSLYKKLVTQVWNRWKEIFSNIKEWKNKFLVEYFAWENGENFDKEFILSESKKIFENKFSQKNLKDEEIILVENKKILWWMKIFFNDDMVDISFLKIQNLIKK